MNTPIIPGQSGVPGCAYILASGLGAGALYSLNYYKYSGTITPLLILTILETLTINYNY